MRWQVRNDNVADVHIFPRARELSSPGPSLDSNSAEKILMIRQTRATYLAAFWFALYCVLCLFTRILSEDIVGSQLGLKQVSSRLRATRRRKAYLCSQVDGPFTSLHVNFQVGLLGRIRGRGLKLAVPEH